MRIQRHRVAVLLAVFASLCAPAAMAQDDWRAGYSVGQAVQFSISGRADDMQPCTVVQNDAGSAMRVECKKFKQWAAGVYMVYDDDDLAAAAPGTGGQGKSLPLSRSDFPEFEWRADYPVGAAVSFTISGRAGDAQPCIVSENRPNSVMRVRCETFKTWRAGEYPVYAPEYITGGVPKKVEPTPPEPTPPKPDNLVKPVAGDVKLGNYACYGSGGAVLAGFNFTLVAGNRYVDASGNGGGTFEVDGGDIVFTGGELDGMRYRNTGPNHYRLGQQASCEPY